MRTVEDYRKQAQHALELAQKARERAPDTAQHCPHLAEARG
jgi:hypothetical protein